MAADRRKASARQDSGRARAAGKAATGTERRSSRRSRADQESSRERVGLRERAAGLADAVRSHPTALLAVVAVTLVAVMLYGPTRNYYVAVRTNQELQAYYDALAEQNKVLEGDLERLQSEEGVVDEAHRRGYIKDGETGMVIEGLPEEDLSAMLGDIELPDTRPWYIKVLDVLFLYDKESWQ